jgi:hypothetical protein
MIPAFTSQGWLPPGIHEANWDEILVRFAHNAHRKRLFVGLRKALLDLAFAGCKTVYLDGSYITSKEKPGDFDACWDDDSIDWDALDETLLSFANARASQKAKYGGELFPMCWQADPWGNSFLEFFQIDKNTGNAKGIIKLSLIDWQA